MKSNSTVIDKNGSDTGKKRKKASPPKKIKVIYHNDDYTPMEFVTWSLIEFFNKTEIDAQSITLEVHKLGYALAGVYDYQIAEQKYMKFYSLLKKTNFPCE